MTLPTGVLSRLSGGTRQSARGYSLDPQTHMLLELDRLLGFPKLHDLSIDKARAENRRSVRLVAPEPMPVHRVENVTLGTAPVPLRARVYVPRAFDGPAGALVYFHGGGFCICDLDTHDAFCRELAVKADIVVISVDYRMGPEQRFPAAVDDSIAAYRYVREHAAEFGVDANRVAVGGDSAGGNLSAVICQSAEQGGFPAPFFQLLIYPALEFITVSPSRREFGKDLFLTQTLMDWFLDNYFEPGADRTEVRASPARATSLRGQPPAHVVTAGFDPLLDEGEAYAQRLEQDGVRVTYQFEPALIHGFLQMSGAVEAAEQANDRICRAVRTAFFR